MRIIETSHLKQWASTVAANSRFPHVIKGLINETSLVQYLRMPSGDASWVPGFDGVVISQEGTQFVPAGFSVWEMGTDSAYVTKANKDYSKRSNKKDEDKITTATDVVSKNEVTFVFVTPYVWVNKNEWVAERRKEKVWKNIIVIDGVDLEEWLMKSPVVSLDLAAEISLIINEGLQSIDQAWAEWRGYSDPELIEDVVVAGRAEQEKEVITYLSDTNRIFTVRGDSPREAWGFVLAVLRRLTDEEREKICSRVVIANDEAIASRLSTLHGHIIIVKQANNQISNVLVRAGNYVIVAEGNSARTNRDVIQLPRADRQLFVKGLQAMNLSEEEAKQKARECALSTTIFQRLMPAANASYPIWAAHPLMDKLIPALLAIRWDESIEADQKVLCSLSNVKDYASVEENLQPFLLVDEPPLKKINEMWVMTAPIDAFQLGARYITRTQFERFKQTFIEVFAEIDPKVELPPDEWLMSDIKGKRGTSKWLRSGLAESLLMIAECSFDNPLPGNQSPKEYVEEIVRAIPDLNNDWRILASIRDQYTLIMEAAPRPLLNSLEHILEANCDDIKKLFAEGNGLFGGGSMHTNILWALEMLAWSPDYLLRVTSILAKLASIDPGGRLLNRPINSLRDIFLWWHPGTNADNDHRLSAIDSILETYPGVGWSLLELLLPGRTLSVSPTPKPRWADFGDLSLDSLSSKGRNKYLEEIINRAIDYLGCDVKRWNTLLESMWAFKNEQRERVVSSFEKLSQEEITQDQRLLFWNMIREFATHQRSFISAEWALPLEIVERIEKVLEFFDPSDIVEKNRWLFNDVVPEISDMEEDFDIRKTKVEELRKETIKNILDERGIGGIIKLGTDCSYSDFVASIAVLEINDINRLAELIIQTIGYGEKGISFGGQISGYSYQLFKNDWLEKIRIIVKTSLIKSANETAMLLRCLPEKKEIWNFVEEFGDAVVSEYWRQKPFIQLTHNPSDQLFQIGKLIENGRASDLFTIIRYENESISTDLLIKIFNATLQEIIQNANSGKVNTFGVDSYSIKKYLGILRKRTDITKQQLMQCEFNILPLLSSIDSKGIALYEYMAENPLFFVEVICKAYLPANIKDSDRSELSPEEQAWARNAYTLLQGMDQIPGAKEDQTIDENGLLEWIDAVRIKAHEMDRYTIAEYKIGELLAHSPNDPDDGGWPHKTVRNVIEKRISSDMERGLLIGKRNLRGVVTKAMFEGGQQERELAKEYQKYNQLVKSRWQRTAAILQSMSDQWLRDAKREDARAEQSEITIY